jgi:flavin reductase
VGVVASTAASPLLRAALGRFATGVAVVTFRGPDGPRGLTVNSFTSVSLTPPLVLVAVAKRAASHDLLSVRSFCVNVMGAEQEALAMHFAGHPTPRESPWVDGTLSPRLAGALAHLDCSPWGNYEGGDHTLFIGEVADFGYRDGDALGFRASGFTTIADGQLGHEYLI